MSVFEIDVDDLFNFFCPITGAQILGPEFFCPSLATAFTYSPEAGDFDSIDEPYKTIWDDIEEQYADDEFGAELWERFCARLQEEYPHVLVFGFTSHGMACGPVSSTVYIAIDFAYSLDDDDDE
jgi:hypothetical protein